MNDRFSRIWAIGVLVLIAATWRLWFPQASLLYPVVPWWGLSSTSAKILATTSSVIVIVALAFAASGMRFQSVAWWCVAFGFAIGFVGDQHRLQPWAYQSAIYAVVFATMNAASSRRWLIPLAASVYIYSAAGKLDYQFTHTVGQEFLNALLRPVGGLPEAWDVETRAKLALVMPVGELAVGIGLLIPWTRRIAGYAAIGLHATLIGILGPWSLGHSNGVLLWNVLLILQAWLLFVGWDKSSQSPQLHDPDAGTSKTRPSLRIISQAIAIVAFVMPVFERAGYWDHWLSWSLYSPHTSRVDVELFAGDVAKLPDSVRQHVAKSDDGDRWQTLSLSDWSLTARGVPVYPQARYQLELVRRLCDQYDVDSGVRVYVKGVSDRWTGKREEVWLKGASNLD